MYIVPLYKAVFDNETYKTKQHKDKLVNINKWILFGWMLQNETWNKESIDVKLTVDEDDVCLQHDTIVSSFTFERLSSNVTQIKC